MAEYIEREAAIQKMRELKRYAWAHPNRAEYRTTLDVDDVLFGLHYLPAADVVEVVPELRKIVELLHNEYEKAKQLDFVYDPLAYAVYQVWKAVDGRRKNGR